MTQVSYDRRAVTLDGKRTLLLSGAIHYPRSTPKMWPELMKRSRQAGLNTVETYVFWNLHERQRGVFDFSDRLDLLRYCQLAQEQGLHVILRIGPYICAETNYGGFPSWLRDVPGIRMRTYNEPFMQEMERWLRFLCNYLRSMFAPNGGPIILVQIENEYANVAEHYREEGQKYLQWAFGLGQSLHVNIPFIMCVGGTNGAIETINGFYGHEQLEHYRSMYPNHPVLWTENWTGWYDTFGYPHHTRVPQDVAYAVARFFAAGGAGMNYYMWHGGTNFGREAMYLQTTSYDYDAPLDEFGSPTTKFHHLMRLHQILHSYIDMLLTSEPAAPQALGARQVAYVYQQGERSLAFLCNDETEAGTAVSFHAQQYHLAARSVIILDGERLLMDTALVDSSDVVQRVMQPLSGCLAPFTWWPEPMPSDWPQALQASTTYGKPIEQLMLTKDETDYCWYTARFAVAAEQKGEGTLTVANVADVVHVFIDGQFRATSRTPLAEERGPTDGKGFEQSFVLQLAPGEHELSLLCCAIGLIKGDWMIGGQNMAEERKGFWGQVSWNDEVLLGQWTMQPGLLGERYEIFCKTSVSVQWEGDWQLARGCPLRWWRTTFDRPQGDIPLVADLQGMNKGLVWLNGRCIGRYWLTQDTGQPDSPRSQRVDSERIVTPTQRYYHLPAEWLMDHNVLILFEELGGDPISVQLCRWIPAR